MGSIIASVFGMDAATFRAVHWPARPAIAHGHAERFVALDPASSLARWIDELELGFAAHACAARGIGLAANERLAEPALDHEAIVLVSRGRAEVAGEALAPGSAMFLPRGRTREIVALDALHVDVFTFRVPTWIELVANTLLGELAAESAWRAPATAPADPGLVHAVVALLAGAPPR